MVNTENNDAKCGHMRAIINAGPGFASIGV